MGVAAMRSRWEDGHTALILLPRRCPLVLSAPKLVVTDLSVTLPSIHPIPSLPILPRHSPSGRVASESQGCPVHAQPSWPD